MKTALVCLGIALVCPAGLLAQHTHSPYAGDRTRELKALSAQELEAYVKGEGMGMALPAELNSYPGPHHVLELAEELGLSVEQKEALSGSPADHRVAPAARSALSLCGPFFHLSHHENSLGGAARRLYPQLERVRG